jgi:hypothetical protein
LHKLRAVNTSNITAGKTDKRSTLGYLKYAVGGGIL